MFVLCVIHIIETHANSHFQLYFPSIILYFYYFLIYMTFIFFCSLIYQITYYTKKYLQNKKN